MPRPNSNGSGDDFEPGTEATEEQELLPLLFVLPDDVPDVERHRTDAVEDAERSPDGNDVGLPRAVDELAIDAFHEDAEQAAEEEQPKELRTFNAILFIKPGRQELPMKLRRLFCCLFHTHASFLKPV